jgi:hypothetical protein
MLGRNLHCFASRPPALGVVNRSLDREASPASVSLVAEPGHGPQQENDRDGLLFTLRYFNLGEAGCMSMAN